MWYLLYRHCLIPTFIKQKINFTLPGRSKIESKYASIFLKALLCYSFRTAYEVGKYTGYDMYKN